MIFMFQFREISAKDKVYKEYNDKYNLELKQFKDFCDKNDVKKIKLKIVIAIKEIGIKERLLK